VTTRRHKVQIPFGRAAVQIFAPNDRMNQILIEHLDPTAWRARPPGNARTIAAIFTPMHNARSKRVRLIVSQLKIPFQLNRAHFRPQQARAGLGESAARCAEMLTEALGTRPELSSHTVSDRGQLMAHPGADTGRSARRGGKVESTDRGPHAAYPSP
jgi:hypothetical protein